MDKGTTLITTDDRLFYLSDDVDSGSIGKLCFNLAFLVKKDDEEDDKQKNYKRLPIHLYINSGGGYIYDMWALIDLIEHSKTPIYTYCTGYAMSAAFNIFLAGHKRYATRHATFMYHQMSYCVYGKYQDIVESRDEMDYLTKQIESYVVEKTNYTQEDLDEIRLKKKDVYIHADEALKLGIIDEII